MSLDLRAGADRVWIGVFDWFLVLLELHLMRIDGSAGCDLLKSDTKHTLKTMKLLETTFN